MRNAPGSGLEGVLVADTRLSEVDGERGRLIVAGFDVEQLAARAGYEEACALLWTGQLPDAVGREAVRAGLGRARVRAFARLTELGSALGAASGMDALRAAIAHLPSPMPGEAGAEAAEAAAQSARDEALDLTGAMATFAAAWARLHSGQAPLAPDPNLGHAADYLRMVHGVAASPAAARALDAYLVTVIDHGMNASTFAARVVTSTGSDAVSAVVAAIGALKGPLHGGAPGPVLDMLDAIGEPARAVAWLEAELAAGRRIMGMGHRIYRVRDPRAAVLEQALLALEAAGAAGGARGGGSSAATPPTSAATPPTSAATPPTSGARTNRLALARAVERAAEGVLGARHPDRPLRANVEFYTALLLDGVGLPRAAFTPTFAVGRSAGWLAHIAEQRATGRLIRPASRYIGKLPAPTTETTAA